MKSALVYQLAEGNHCNDSEHLVKLIVTKAKPSLDAEKRTLIFCFIDAAK